MAETNKQKARRLFTCALALLFAVFPLISPLSGAFTVAADGNEPLKTRATYFNDEERANLAENVKGSYSSAKSNYTSAGETILSEYDFEALWDLIPGQNIPRSYAVNQPKGCLNCGLKIDAYGNYPYTYSKDDPWKLTCPACGMRFPTNDFESYYKSGLDETGRFQPSKADKQYLKNVLYPEKGENWGVDDGYGYKHTNGEKYFFIAYYNHWANWYDILQKPISYLYNAYLYTGEQKYADAGIVYLTRFADFYPEYSLVPYKWAAGYRHSGGDHGKIVGSIWEPGVITDFLLAYDAFFPAFKDLSSEALSFIKSKLTGISSYKDVMIKIEDGVFKQIYPAIRNQNIYGNNGMHQRIMCIAAVIIDDPVLSKQWLEYAFKPSSSIATGLNISATFVNDVDRDGFGNEAAPHYNALWLGSYITVADTLQGYTIKGTDITYDLYQNVKFKKMFIAMYKLLLGKAYTPNIGDADSTGNFVNYMNLGYTLKAYVVYREPLFAQLVYWLCGGNTDSLTLDAFTKDPSSIGKEIKEVVQKYGELDFESVNLAGYGYASLMNVNKTTASGDLSNEKNVTYGMDSISVINLGALSTVTKTAENVTFTPASESDMLSLGFRMNTMPGTYDIIITAPGVSGAGKFDVYFDGRLLQNAVKFPDSAGESKVYFKKTIQITNGYHVISFVPSEGNVGSLKLKTITTIKTTSDSTKSSVNKETSVYMYYGKNYGHGHKDTLNMGVFAYNMDLMPDLGYPEYCDGTPNQVYWVNNTVSHNTVLVNDSMMNNQIIAEPLHYDDNEFVKLISVDAASVYPAASEYMRTSALIRYSDRDSYVVDLFRVVGGSKHTYSFHPAESTGYVSTGLEFTAQTNSKGEYVGTLLSKNGTFGAGSSSSGYQWLKNVRKDEDPDKMGFSMDWSIVDTRRTATASDVHLKLTMLGEYSSVYLTNGVPPTNKAGNPAQLDYLLVNNTGSKLDSLFVSVIEPYTGMAYIKSSEIAKVTENGKEVTDNGVRALKITFENGRTDYIVYCEDTSRKLNVAGKFDFSGFFGVYSEKDGEITTYANDATIMVKPGLKDRYTGKVVSFTEEISTENSITVSLDESVDEKTLAGRYLYVVNTGKATAFKILGASKSGGNYVLDIGDVTLAASYKSSTDTSKGYTYCIAAKNSVYVPLSALDTDDAKLEKLYAATSSDIVTLTLSNDVRGDGKAGDLVGRFFPVSASANQLYKVPSYKFSLTEDSADLDYFEIKDNALYLKRDVDRGYTDSFKIKIKAESENDVYYGAMELSILTKSKSAEQKYPVLTLSETKENADILAGNDTSDPSGPSDPSDPGEKDPEDQPAGGVNPVIFIIIGVIAVAAIAAVVILVLKKKKNG